MNNKPVFYLDRVLKVCLESGSRGRGIFKVMEENRNLMRCLLDCPESLNQFPWFEGCIEGHELFFNNILNALRPTFPNAGVHPEFRNAPYNKWPRRDCDHHLISFAVIDPQNHDECLNRVIQVCEKTASGDLLYRLDQNRHLLQTLYKHSEILNKIFWVEKGCDKFPIF